MLRSAMGLTWAAAVLHLLLLCSVSVRTVHCQMNVYMVRMDDTPAVLYTGSRAGFAATAPTTNAKFDGTSAKVQNYKRYLEGTHDQMLATMLPDEDYVKLYSYVNTVNGFAAAMTDDQAARMATNPLVLQVELDSKVQTVTTHTPNYLGLTSGAWPQIGGVANAGDGVVIGIVDTGINPVHPSFANDPSNPYGPLSSFTGSCEVAPEFPEGSCNYKLIGARHFSAAAQAAGDFNATVDFASPLDGDGHGSHTASTAAGNYGVPVVLESGLNFGLASGMAPRARIAIYKCLYRFFGGYFADVVAGIDQAVADGVDVLNLSIGPGTPSGINALYFSIFDIALLGAVKAGIVALQAAGNAGPYVYSILSWSPWIVSVAASSTDRIYSGSVILGDGQTLTGGGFALGTNGTEFYKVVLSTDVNTTFDPTSEIDECQRYYDFDKSAVEGNILVCTYNSNIASGFIATVESVADTVKNLSAVGVIFLAEPYLDRLDFSTLLLPKGIPAIVLTGDAVKKFMSYYSKTKTSGALARVESGVRSTYTGAGPIVASFSSRGPDFNDFNYVPADVLKPNIMGPGVDILAAWSPIGIDEINYRGESFATLSGTSMATPHLAGIAALIKAKNPTFTPAAIHSAIATTATSFNEVGAPLLARYPTNNPDDELGPASVFDMGSGQVDATAALNPGLIFEAGFMDYVKFLCITPKANASEVSDTTGEACPVSGFAYQSDLNMPYVSIGILEGSRAVPRTVTNVGTETETYSVRLVSPANVTSSVIPASLFSIAPGATQTLDFNFRALVASNISSFGSLHLIGSLGHTVTVPIAITNMTL